MVRNGRCLVVLVSAALGSLPAVVSAQNDPFGGMPRSLDGVSVPRATPVPICFPPNPPPLGRPVPRTLGATGRFAAPDELAPFVNEPFYPQLSTRLLTRTLTEKQRQELERYQTGKRAAQAELRAEWEKLRAAEPDARRTALAAFARRQTPKLRELEKTAEQLRHDLSAGGNGWDDLREWHLSDNDRRGFSPVEIAQVMRSFAFYRAGLSPGQRRLLREVALELLMAGETAEKASANQPHVFFQPELARVTLPDDVPADLAAKIASYQTKKALIKKELFDAVRKHDGARFGFLHNPLRSLASKHETQLAELETLADSIRLGLSQHAAPPKPPERSPLPVAVTDRLATLLRQRDEAERDATVRIEELIKSSRSLPVAVSYRFDSDGLRFIVRPIRARGGLSADEMRKTDAVRTAMSEIADAFGRRIAELVNERDAIRRAAGEAIGSTNVAAIDAALGVANRVATLRQNERAYEDYRTAAFEPGLSPEQRRLLLDAAILALHLPLPRAELQPTRRANTW